MQEEKDFMKYDVATNFDFELLDHIKSVDKNQQIISLFGKMKEDIIGGGRTSTSLPDVSMKQLLEYNERCKSQNIRFNYLLNPLCLGNRDVIASEHKKILEFISKLYDSGIESVTVCSPYLCELIKKHFPDIKVTIGLYAVINTFQQAKQWIDLGADELTLMHSFNRDFTTIKKMLTAFKPYDVNIRLIANNGCLHDCPFSVNHGAGVSHSSTQCDASTKNYVDYNIINCYYRKITKPANILASEWIRPEDIHYYKNLCKETGNDRLVIKLVERTKSTTFLKNVIDSYLAEKHDGNLRYLLNWVGDENGSASMADSSGYVESIMEGNLNAKAFSRYMTFFNMPQVNIDNTKLNGFLEHFINNNHCKEKICWMENREPEEHSDLYCYYCYEWSKKVISFDSEDSKIGWKNNTERLKESLNTSEMFGLMQKSKDKSIR